VVAISFDGDTAIIQHLHTTGRIVVVMIRKNEAATTSSVKVCVV
jgi:hypothetical protein